MKQENVMNLSEYLGDMYDVDDGEFHFFLESVLRGVSHAKRIVYLNGDGDGLHRQSCDKLILKKTSTSPKEEGILKAVFVQLWTSDNGVSTNIPTEQEDYPEGTKPQEVIDCLGKFGLIPDYVDAGIDEADTFEALGDVTVRLDYVLQFDMSGRGDWFGNR